MLKIRLYAALVAAFCVAVIGFYKSMFSFSHQQTHFPQPIMSQSSEIDTHFFPGPSNSNCPLKSYILVGRYAGQQGGGVKALFQLQHWVKDTSLPMMVVEPFVQDSILGVFKQSLQQLKFSDLFDLENFNRVSRSEGVGEMIPWETYVNKYESVRAVLVRIGRAGSSRQPTVLWSTQPGSGDCWKNNRYKITINGKNLCYVRVVDYPREINSSRIFSARELCSLFFNGLELNTVNLVFNMWAEVVGPMLWPLPPYSSDHWSESSVQNGSMSSTHKLKESPKLLLDIKNYQKEFLMGHAGLSYVAVMLRTEYLVRHLNYTKENTTFRTFQNLLNETVNITAVLKAKLGIENVFVTADIGSYGSSSWRKRDTARIGKQVKRTVEKLYQNRWTYEQWEQSFSQATVGVKHRGYIAAVQREVASQASCLVLVGGGSFQELALRRYVGHTELERRCIYFVGFEKVKKLQTLKDKLFDYFCEDPQC